MWPFYRAWLFDDEDADGWILVGESGGGLGAGGDYIVRARRRGRR